MTGREREMTGGNKEKEVLEEFRVAFAVKKREINCRDRYTNLGF